jgi:hypothetical protein
MIQTVRNGILFILGITLFYFTGYFLLLEIGLLSEIPNDKNLLNWDASWYYSIVKEGYYLDLNDQSNSGFFPGFPFLWKFLGFSPLFISVLNMLLFLCAIFILKAIIKASLLKTLLIVSLPSSFFFFAPYSEALFYFFTVLFIFAWLNEKLIGIIVFAFLLSFVRPVFFFLIPAIIGLYLLKIKSLRDIKKSSLTILFLLIGAALGFAIIGFETGDYFAYSKSQVAQWGHDFKLTSLPLTTWRGYRILWLDGLALFIAVLALVILILDFYKVQILKLNSSLTAIEAIGLGYILMILIYILFFHPIEDGRTTILSMNRYVFCNPFLHFIILKRIHTINYKIDRFYFPIIAGLAVLLLLGFPFYAIIELTYLNSIIFSIFLFMAFMALSLMFFKIKYNKLLLALTTLMFFFLQLYLYNSFLKGNWIG